jgi:hypothetical protein
MSNKIIAIGRGSLIVEVRGSLPGDIGLARIIAQLLAGLGRGLGNVICIGQCNTLPESDRLAPSKLFEA